MDILVRQVRQGVFACVAGQDKLARRLREGKIARLVDIETRDVMLVYSTAEGIVVLSAPGADAAWTQALQAIWKAMQSSKGLGRPVAHFLEWSGQAARSAKQR